MTEMERGAAVRGGAEGAAESNLGDRLVAISREQGGERPNRGEWLEKEHKRLLEERGVESDSEPKSGSGKSSSQEKESVEEMREWWNSPKRMEEIREQVEYVANCWNKGEDGELAENKNEFYNSVWLKEICKLNLASPPESGSAKSSSQEKESVEEMREQVEYVANCWNKGEDGELAKNKNEFYNSVGLKEICKNEKKPSAYDKPHSSYDRTPTSSRSFSSAYERPSSSSRTPSAYDRPSSSRRAPSASDMSSSAQTSSRAPSSYDRPSLSSLGRSEETHSMMSSASSTGSVKTSFN